ncbi:MAG: 16S rRNA (cytosine(1402)-N(4))-methyltransferase RsmH [Lachnospiraceae bacterium]|nr:16S rRNA (cytosine(1402)-N(4))-methyltransferase RsmH [Lachnospiraceae bacterium]
MEFVHKSILLNEVIEGLNIKPDGIYADGTLGGAGHSEQIAGRLSENGKLIGIDQDEDAIRTSAERLKEFIENGKAVLIRDNYSNIKQILNGIGIEKVDGILLDLGVSSYQFDEGERGFSYRFDAPLDMRMDTRQELSAYDIVNGYPESELSRILKDYGEEKFARNIAKHIVAARSINPVKTTFELNEIIKASIPAKMRAGKGHPSKQTFQAIRIECNSELDVLKNTLGDMISLLKPDGRLAIITFHSLEDRIVKNAFKTAANPCICPANFPVCTCGRKPLGESLTRKPILPSEEEMEENPRSKSAKLRIFVRNEEKYEDYFKESRK